jgi:L-iditol 2-dehydrogenase
MNKMKAVVVKAPMDFSVEKIPMPTCPEGGMLLQVLACGLCGSDLRTLRSGHHRVKLPFTIGHEITGKVIETGKNYRGKWKTGEILAVSPLVFCGQCEFCKNGELELCTGYKEIAQAWPGGFAEYMAIPGEAVERGTIQQVPEGLSPVHATIVEPLSSCVNAQEKGNISLGETVLIIGAGPIGTLHVELARARGATKIIVADISEDRLKLVKEYAPDYILNSTKENLQARVLEITGGYGPGVIITANPAPETQVQAVEMAKKGGRVLLFGGLPKDKASPGVNMNTVHYHALQLIGTTIFSPKHNRVAKDLLASGKVSGDKFISHQFPLDDFVKGAKMALEGKVRKAVFIP